MTELPAPLAPFAAYPQFILFALPSKVPCDWRTGIARDAHDPAGWGTFEQARGALDRLGPGYALGFIFTEHDPFWFLDLDHCLVEGQWTPAASAICEYFAGAAIEISTSGTGLHIFGTGALPEHGCRCAAHGLELYHTGRGAVLTGTGAIGSAAFDCSDRMQAFAAQYFPPSAAKSTGAGWSDGPDDDWRGPTDDADLIRRAMQSRSAASAFGTTASFADLWTANAQVLGKVWPDVAKGYNASHADAALAQHLAFWTGRDCERIMRLMRQSTLMREKFDRADYLPRTILTAVGQQAEVLQDKAPEPLILADSEDYAKPAPVPVEGSTILTVSEQITMFSGCVYVRNEHRALIPGGHLLKPDQFRVAYGGYSFQMDLAGERVSRDSWEAFTQSQAFRCPKADGMCFKPQLPPAALVKRGGQTLANTWWPIEVDSKPGDASTMLRHLDKVLPDARDREIMLSYMAACVQHAGDKFQWAPLLQGVEGNGKTLFTRCVARAIGDRYVHWPKAAQIGGNFNGWLLNKLFFGVEDIYVPGEKEEVIEILKPMITGGDGLEIERKGIDQISADICGNFMFNSNHKDAVRKTQNDRRFAIFYSAQQHASDLARDGMHGDYFPRLYDWLNADGYSIVTHYLQHYAIPTEFDPSHSGQCQRAPRTSSTDAAVTASAGSVEQEIAEAIAQQQAGFCGGWVSTVMLDRLLETAGLGRRLTRSKRCEILVNMGFAPHPALPSGRVNNPVIPDGAKPRLYIRSDSPLRALSTAAEVAKAYEAANSGFRS